MSARPHSSPHAIADTIVARVLELRCTLKRCAEVIWYYLIVNGPEYSHYFEDRLRRNGIPTRHSRLHRPNDNAHIERFNRTIQDECLGRYLSYKTPTGVIQAKITTYLDFYNTKRIHLGLQLRTPTEVLQRF
jgi:transposase InsO family protein